MGHRSGVDGLMTQEPKGSVSLPAKSSGLCTAWFLLVCEIALQKTMIRVPTLLVLLAFMMATPTADAKKNKHEKASQASQTMAPILCLSMKQALSWASRWNTHLRTSSQPKNNSAKTPCGVVQRSQKMANILQL